MSQEVIRRSGVSREAKVGEVSTRVGCPDLERGQTERLLRVFLFSLKGLKREESSETLHWVLRTLR